MKKVAILGYTPTRAYAPYKDDRFEIWGLNDLYRFKAEKDIQRWTRWFNFHQDIPSPTGRTSYHDCLLEYAKWDCPVYLIEKSLIVPNSIKYPLEEISNLYGNYFTNSISYMIALAIYEGFEEIGVYGVDMATDSEYGQQRPSCEYWLGVAVGKGIKTYVHPVADLLKTRALYGYDAHKELDYSAKLKGMIDKMNKDKANAQAQAKQAEQVAWQYSGAIEAMRQADRMWKGLK